MRLRSLLLARRWPALALALAALAVRIVVPAGMMPGHGANGPTLIVCSGTAAMPGMTGMPDRPAPAHDAGHDVPCAFTGLFAAALAAGVVPLLPILAFVVAVVLRAAPVPVVLRAVRLRPPSRAPPAFA